MRQLWNMLELARAITIGALNRNESRGAHYKPEFPERDDANFLKTTMANWSSDGPRFSAGRPSTPVLIQAARAPVRRRHHARESRRLRSEATGDRLWQNGQ